MLAYLNEEEGVRKKDSDDRLISLRGKGWIKGFILKKKKHCRITAQR